MSETLEELFLSKCRSSPNGCLLWEGNQNSRGYGLMYVPVAIDCGSWLSNHRMVLAHRLAWFLGNGSFPEQCALHRCDTPLCVNVAHLFDGSRKDNARDMVRKGRAPHSKITPLEVIEIRAMRTHATRAEIAERFGITVDHVSKVTSRTRWSGVGGREGEGCFYGWRKISPRQVIEIRTRHAAGEAFASIARDIGVHARTVSRIAKGQTRRTVRS